MWTTGGASAPTEDLQRRGLHLGTALMVVVAVALVLTQVSELVLEPTASSRDLWELFLTLALLALVGGVSSLGGLIGRRVLAATEHRRDRLRALQDGSSDAVLAVREGRVAYANRKAEELFGRAELEGCDVLELATREDEAALARALGSGRGFRLPGLGLVGAGGEELRVDLVAKVLPGDPPEQLLFLRDRRPEDELRRQLTTAQRLEPVARLAGGVAHDFRNLLTAVISSAWVLEQKLEGPEREIVSELSRAARSSEALVRQLLAFSRLDPELPEVTDLAQRVRGNEQVLRRLLRSDVELTVEVSEEQVLVLADGGKLDQVVLNLVVNARDAVAPGGSIRVSLAAEAPWAVLEVEDSGVGMSPELLERIFDPFFTTKSADRGTGLGLATVHGIVQRAGGSVEVVSEPGAGSCFTVRLPLEEDAEAAKREEEAPAVLRPGGGCVLVVDDSHLVRQTVRAILDHLGYEVLEAADGAAAWELLLVQRERLHLVITDIVMPGVGGVELAARIRERWPSLPVLVTTGYAEREVLDDLDEEQRSELLRKPFTVDELRGAIGRALDEGARLRA